MRKRFMSIMPVFMAMSLVFSGCGKTGKQSAGKEGSELNEAVPPVEIEVMDADDAENHKILINTPFAINTTVENGFKAEGSVYTITKAGEYTLSGLLSEGRIIVAAGEDDEVNINLNTTSINCSTAAPINVQSAGKVKLKSEENSYNEVNDKRQAVAENSADDDINGNAAIYAKSDLSLTGKGALVVNGGFNNGIQSKDDLSVKNVTLKVTSVNNAIKGNDSVTIESGEIMAVSTAGNGIKTSNSGVSSKGNQKGNILISGGNINIKSSDEGIDAAFDTGISGECNITVNALKGKGIKADNKVVIDGGTVSINAGDDGIHANSASEALENGNLGEGTITINGGNIMIVSSDDGIHADKNLNINDGYIVVSKSVEGIEANRITMAGGSCYVYATDDGVNASSGDGGFEFGNMMTRPGFSNIQAPGSTGTPNANSGNAKETPLIRVTGGYLDVTTPGGDTDAIDSNGNYEQTGGFVLVKGGNSSGRMAGSVDVDGSITVTGGTIVALGGICETPVNSCNAYILNSVSFTAGEYELKDNAGKVIIAFSLDSAYTNGWICSDGMITGTEYILNKDGSKVTGWTQTEGTMGSSGVPGGFGGFGSEGTPGGKGDFGGAGVPGGFGGFGSEGTPGGKGDFGGAGVPGGKGQRR